MKKNLKMKMRICTELFSPFFSVCSGEKKKKRERERKKKNAKLAP